MASIPAKKTMCPAPMQDVSPTRIWDMGACLSLQKPKTNRRVRKFENQKEEDSTEEMKEEKTYLNKFISNVLVMSFALNSLSTLCKFHSWLPFLICGLFCLSLVNLTDRMFETTVRLPYLPGLFRLITRQSLSTKRFFTLTWTIRRHNKTDHILHAKLTNTLSNF